MSMPWKFSIAGSQFQPEDLDQMPAFCLEAGADRVEGTTRLFAHLDDRALGAIGKRFHDARVRFDTYHLPYGEADDLASLYQTIRLGAVERIRREMQRSAMLGARIGIVHPTVTRFNVDLEGIDRLIHQLRTSLDGLLPLAEQLNYTLALENVPKRSQGQRLGSIPDHWRQLAQACDHPNLGFCLDTGHALMSMGLGHEAEYFQAVGTKLVAFHLADNPGDRDLHLAPGRGLVDWQTVFQQAKTIGYTGTMCIETPPFAPGPPYTPDSFRDLLRDTTTLAHEALT